MGVSLHRIPFDREEHARVSPRYQTINLLLLPWTITFAVNNSDSGVNEIGKKWGLNSRDGYGKVSRFLERFRVVLLLV